MELRRRELLRAGAGLALGAALAGCGIGRGLSGDSGRAYEAEIDGDLVYFNWGYYLDPQLMRSFEDRYGVKVIESNFDSMPAMMAKLRGGNTYDLIFPSAEFSERLIQSGQLLQIDRDKLKNADTLISFFDNPWYDPGSAHSIPYSLYVTGIGYRSDLVTGMTGSWRDLANPSAEGRTYVLDDFQEGIGMANLVNGWDLNTVVEAELEASADYLIDLKPDIRGFSSDTLTNMRSGNAWIQHMWNGDVVNVRNTVDNPEDYTFQKCKEGLPVGSDCYAIPVNAEHPGTAIKFIDFMLEPENAAQNVAYTGYPEPNRGAEEEFATIVADDPSLDVTVHDLETGDEYANLDEQARLLWDRTWTEVRAS